MSEELIVERDGAVATLRFNRPDALNAFTPEMNVRLGELLRSLRDDETVSVLVLTGTGRAFSSGADLKALAEPGRLGRPADVGYERVRAAGLRTAEILEMRKPTIAAVNGIVAGFALGLAFACDILIAANSASFHVAFSRIGYIPDAGTSWLLTRLVGLQQAKLLFFTGDPIEAAEAMRIGLVTRVVADDDLRSTALDLARTIAARPKTAVRMGKALLDRANDVDFRTAVELEAQAQGILGTTQEHQEAVRAFAERKKRS